MHEFLINLRLVKEVWQSIESNDDARFKEKRDEIRTKCESILKKCSGEWANLFSADVTKASDLPQQQLAEHSLHVVRDVLTFVASACSFYDMVSSYRPLTPEERHMGDILSSLLMQVQTIFPKGANSSGSKRDP